MQFAAGPPNGAECPPASVYGHASAITPLLTSRSQAPSTCAPRTHKLPDLVADLNGQIEVTLAGKVDTGRGRRHQEHASKSVPDAPVSKFVLSMQGGKRGFLQSTPKTSAGRTPRPTRSRSFTGQNGKVYDTTPLIANSCKKKQGKH